MVKRKIRAVLYLVETKLTSHGETIVNLELSANAHESKFVNLQANMSKLTSIAFLENAPTWRDAPD